MNSFSKQIEISELDGQLISPSNFGLDDSAVFQYLRILRVSTGNISIRIQDYDDWVLISDYPFTLETIRFEDFWLLPSEALTVDIICSFIPLNSAIS